VVTNTPLDNGTAYYLHDRGPAGGGQGTGGNVIAELDQTGTTAREYIWLPEAGYAGTDMPLAVVDGVNTASPQLYYVHTDHINRPIRMSTTAKVMVWQAEWNPWGGVQSLSGALANNLRFPGQWFQIETGLHYNWHRHYDPTIGRYTQPDPLGFVDGPSVWAYAKSGPQDNVDPDGRIIGPIAAICRLIPAACVTIVYCARNPSKCKELICKEVHPKHNRNPQKFGNLAMHMVCDVPGCGSDSSATGDASLAFRAAAAEACLILRRLQSLCYSATDPTHDSEIVKAQEKAAKCRAQCISRF